MFVHLVPNHLDASYGQAVLHSHGICSVAGPRAAVEFNDGLAACVPVAAFAGFECLKACLTQDENGSTNARVYRQVDRWRITF